MLEIAVALLIGLMGVISILGSIQVGFGWGAEGPQAGFFPFYIGLIVVIASAFNLVTVLRTEDGGQLFARWGQLRQVLSVVVPTAVYVTIIPYLGMYVSSVLLISVFMMWLGRYRWPTAMSVAIGMPMITFFMFEMWFLVPLPKGPLEKFLGY